MNWIHCCCCYIIYLYKSNEYKNSAVAGGDGAGNILYSKLELCESQLPKELLLFHFLTMAHVVSINLLYNM